jgi:hypothetical protein
MLKRRVKMSPYNVLDWAMAIMIIILGMGLTVLAMGSFIALLK